MTFYIAAPWPLKRHARALRFLLQGSGHTVIARWINLDVTAQDDDANARMDFEDIRAAQGLVLLNPPEYRDVGTGGRHVETGYAYALGKAVHVIGVRSNVFHHVADIRVHEDVHAFLAAIEQVAQ